MDSTNTGSGSTAPVVALTISAAPVTISAPEGIAASLLLGGLGSTLAQTALYQNVVCSLSALSARATNEKILVKGAASSLDSVRWRSHLKTAVNVNPVAPPAFVYTSRSIAPWRWDSGPAPSNVENVVEMPKMRSIMALLGQGGYEYSAASQSVLKTDKDAVLRSLFQLYRWVDSRWLSWLREGRCVLALAEFRDLVAFCGADGVEPGADAEHAATSEHCVVANFAGEPAEGEQARLVPNAADWAAYVGAHTVERDEEFDEPVVMQLGVADGARRRDSVGAQAEAVDFEVRHVADAAYPIGLRVIWRDEMSTWMSGDYRDENDDDVFVSRAGTYAEVVADIWAVTVDAVRGCVMDGPAARFITVMVPKLNRPSVSASVELRRLPCRQFADWHLLSVVLASQRLLSVGRAAAMPSMSHAPITGRDLFALTSYLTVARVRSILPVDRDNQFHVGGGRSILWSSPVPVRLVCALGWLGESSPPHNLADCYVPSGPQLDRMVRFQAVRMGWGFDYIRGLTVSDGRMVSFLEGLGHSLFGLNRLLFNMAYACVDGVLTGWVFDWDAIAQRGWEPSSADDGMAVGVRRRWLEIGLPVNADDEWGVPSSGDTSLTRPLGVGMRKVSPLDVGDLAGACRAVIVCNETHNYNQFVNVEDRWGDASRWYMELHGIGAARGGVEVGFHWFSVPAALWMRRGATLGVTRLPELCSEWWPNDGLWCVAGSSLSTTGVTSRDVNSANISDF